MNHLAHCFLSFGHEDLLVGNFIGDFVKGNAWKGFAPGVQHGILLHRTIDAYTDEHPAAKQSKERIRSLAGRYASAVTDILYDHILALHWNQYHQESFEVFAEKTYQQLNHRSEEMPPVLRERLPRMLEGRFLHGYTHWEGLNWVLSQFSRRLVGGMDSAAVSAAFFGDIDCFSSDFNTFFPDLIKVAQNRITELRLQGLP